MINYLCQSSKLWQRVKLLNMQLTNVDIIKLIRAHKQEFAVKFALKQIALFGSYARNQQNENSDIDIMVDFNEPIGMEIVDLTMDLEKILDHKVDIVTYNAIKDRLYNYIKTDLIYV